MEKGLPLKYFKFQNKIKFKSDESKKFRARLHRALGVFGIIYLKINGFKITFLDTSIGEFEESNNAFLQEVDFKVCVEIENQEDLYIKNEDLLNQFKSLNNSLRSIANMEILLSDSFIEKFKCNILKFIL